MAPGAALSADARGHEGHFAWIVENTGQRQVLRLADHNDLARIAAVAAISADAAASSGTAISAITGSRITTAARPTCIAAITTLGAFVAFSAVLALASVTSVLARPINHQVSAVQKLDLEGKNY